MIRFGPAGLGGVEDAIINIENYAKQGLKACEVSFTHGVYLGKEDALRIGEFAKKHDIYLSIHASYYINLNSIEKEKIDASKKRIIDCCKIGHYFNQKEKTRIVFHAGFYGKKDAEETYQNLKKQIIELLEIVKKNKWNVELCPETMGKKNVFGSVEEISRLVTETGCGFCIDLAHVLARYGDYNFDLIKKSFPRKEWHCHFSGIVYGDKGERYHKLTPREEWKKVLQGIPGDKQVVIINESPEPVSDSVLGLEVYTA